MTIRGRVIKWSACVTAAIAAVAACAHMGPPPGGRADKIPPNIVKIEPANGTTNVKPSDVVFEFDKVVTERPVGVESLRDLVLISPVEGAINADWHRRSIAVSPDKPWRKGTAYTIRLLAGLSDLWGNVRKTDTTITFSTGPTIPNTAIGGVIFDWERGAPAAGAYVQAFTHTDTLLTYVTYADSVGRFTMRAMPPGTYRVRGIMDANKNRGLDPGEAFDTASIVISDSTRIELLAFVHDSLGARLSSMHVEDSLHVRVAFSALLDPTAPPKPEDFRIADPDSVAIGVVTVTPQSRQSMSDTVVAHPVTANGAPSRVPTNGRQANGNQAPSMVRDTTRRPGAMVPSKPIPYREVVLTLANNLRPKTEYTVKATGIRGLGGTKATSSGTFTSPVPQEKADTTAGKKPVAPAPAPVPTVPTPPASNRR